MRHTRSCIMVETGSRLSLLLLEVPSVLLVHEDQVQKVSAKPASFKRTDATNYVHLPFCARKYALAQCWCEAIYLNLTAD